MALLASLLAGFIVVPITLAGIVRIYGNDFAEARQTTVYVPDIPAGSPATAETRKAVAQARKRAKNLRLAGLILVVAYLAAVLIGPLIVVVTGSADQAGPAAMVIAFAGSIPALIGMLLLIRARGLGGDACVLEAKALDPAFSLPDASSDAGME